MCSQTEGNFCDKCKVDSGTEVLIWIDTESFEPKKSDNFNSIKHQEAIELLGYVALCEPCYYQECCN